MAKIKCEKCGYGNIESAVSCSMCQAVLKKAAGPSAAAARPEPKVEATPPLSTSGRQASLKVPELPPGERPQMKKPVATGQELVKVEAIRARFSAKLDELTKVLEKQSVNFATLANAQA